MAKCGVLKDRICWSLKRSRPFIINDEYEVKLLFIDKKRNTVKIMVTNLKTGEIDVMSDRIPRPTKESPRQDVLH
jgi:ribosomal protein S1